MSGVLTSQSADFPRWYQEVLAKATLAETGPVRGVTTAEGAVPDNLDARDLVAIAGRAC